MTIRTIQYDDTTHKVVPIEPTKEMLEAGWEGMGYGTHLANAYRGMLSAAPENKGGNE